MKLLRTGIALIATSVLAFTAAIGQTPILQTLHQFGGTTTLSNGTSGPDGTTPTDFVFDKQGNRYISTTGGGLYNLGAIFELTTQGQYIDIHDFQDELNCTSIAMDSNGNLYGICGTGGAYDGPSAGYTGGTLWKITKNGVYSLIHNFGGSVTNANGVVGQDGFQPDSLVIDSAGDLFGLCQMGGANQAEYGGLGIAWEYTAAGVYKDLHDFGGTIVRANGKSGIDGMQPNSLTIDSSGNLYGTTDYFGDNSPGGVLWKLSTSGTYTDLHDFGTYTDPSTGVFNEDWNPENISIDPSGNLFGDSNNETNVWEYTTGKIYKWRGYLNGSRAPIVFDSSDNAYGSGFSEFWELAPTAALYDLYAPPQQNLPVVLKFDSSGLLNGITGDYSSTNTGALITFAVGPYVSAMSENLNPVVSGQSSTGTITIERPNPTDLVVSLTSSNSDITVPSTVTIPAGTQTATYPITTKASTTDQIATLTAVSGGHDFASTFTASGISLKSITPSGSVVAGNPSTITLALNNQAPTGGLAVTLTSSDPHVIVPSTFTVPATASFADCPISTTGLVSNLTVTISGTDDHSHFVYGYVKLTPTPITGLTVTPTEGVASNAFLATATIGGVAGSGGIPIAMQSNSSFATPPSTVTVPAGQTSVTFQVPTTAVKAQTVVTLKGAINSPGGASTSQTVNFTLDSAPPTLSNLTISPGEGPSGSTFTGTATINEEASTGGTTFALASNSSYVSLPATVTVPEGSTSVTFPVSTTAVSKTISVLLKATIGSAAKTVYFTIDAAPVPALTNLSASPTEALGRTTFTGTVTLASPAPYPISVSTATNSSFVSIPAIVVVPTGSTSANFSVKTQAIYKTISVLLKATLGSTTKTLYITLDATPLPLALSSLTVSPGEGTGGSTFTATVTLNGPAPTGGYVVALATNSSYLSPPASITVPAGSTSVSFSVSSSAVSKSVSALLKASDSSTTKTVYVTLDP